MQLNHEASGNGTWLTDAVTARVGAHYGTLAAVEDDNWVWGGALGITNILGSRSFS